MTTAADQLPEPALRFLRIGEVRPRGWLQTQLYQDLNGFIGNFLDICEQAASDIFVSGRVAGGDKRHWWNGEAEGKWTDGFTRLAHVLGEPSATDRAESYLRRLVGNQDPDGYIGIYDRTWRAAGNRCPGDLWTQTFVLLALLSQYDASGDDAFLDAARRAGLATIARHGADGHDPPFVGSTEESMVLAHNLLIVEPILWFYDLTRDPRFLEFARFCYDSYSEAPLGWPESDGQLSRMSDPDLPFIGHGAHTCAQLRVPLLLYYATGEERYRRAYETGFAKIVDCIGLSGACKSDESIGTLHEPGVPLPGSGYEYCAITELVHSLHLALLCTGDLAYAERAERLALNAAQASRQHDGRAVAYFGADNQVVATKAAGTRWDYSPTHDDIAVCCNPSAARVFAHHVSRMVLRTADEGLLVAFYGPFQADTAVRGVEVNLAASTDYPFDDTIEFEVTTSAPVRFPLHLRVPSWCTTMGVAVDGAAVRRDGDVYIIDAEWSGRSTVRLDFDTDVRGVQAVDGTAAVERGPLVFALPITAQEQSTRNYLVGGYHDLDYTPVLDAHWDYALLLDADHPTRLFRSQFTAAALNDGFPWADPPVAVTASALDPTTRTDDYYTTMTRELTLVPIGATTLRRSCFPQVRRRDTPGPLSEARYAMRNSTP